MSIKVIKRIGFIICLLFMVFIIDCDNVSAIKEWPSYTSKSKSVLLKHSSTYCTYKIKVGNRTAGVDTSSYNEKEIILVPDKNNKSVLFLHPSTGDLFPTDSAWTADQNIILDPSYSSDRKASNMYNYLVDSNGKVTCNGLGFWEDDDGNLVVYDGITLANSQEQIHVDVQVGLLGEPISQDSIDKLVDDKGEGTGSDIKTGDDDFDGVDATMSCDGIIGPNVQKDIKKYLGYIRIIAPIIVIVLSAVDFSKVVLSGDDKDFAKMISTLVKRLIIAVALFIFPALLNFLIEALSKFADSRINGCELGKWW